jgi:hypothetical protein
VAYKYIPASLSSVGLSGIPKDRYNDIFQEALSRQFKNAPNWHTVQEEYPFGSSTLRNIDVRVTSAVNQLTGEKQGDDYKVLLFEHLDDVRSLGSYYYFDNNYWIVVNGDDIKKSAASVVVRRCNNTLRWLATDGSLYTVPCVIDYKVKENRNYSTTGSNLVLPSGFIEVATQLNVKTNLIRPNQRFLFGRENNWIAYKVNGGGVANYNNLETMDNTSGGLLKLTMEVNMDNDVTDDLVNGIADVGQNVYVVTILEGASVSGAVGADIQLHANVTLNGEVVTRTVAWSSSNTAKATVNTSGLVHLVALGESTITCTLQNNTTVTDTITASVVEAPADAYQILVTPNINTILEGDTQQFEVKLWLNGVEQVDEFLFSFPNDDVPVSSYTYTRVDGNTFTVKNLEKYPGVLLVIRCTSGVHVLDFGIELRGAW